MDLTAPLLRTPPTRRALPRPAPLALTSTMLLAAGFLVREGNRAAARVRTMREKGRRIPALDLDIDLPGEAPQRLVVVLGDSSAAGHGLAHADLSVGRRVGCALVERDGRRTVRCAAVDGADIRFVIDHQVEAARDAEVVLVGVGGNDAMRGHSPVRVARETRELIEQVRDVAAPDAAVLLVVAPDLSAAPGLPGILRAPLGLCCRATAWAQSIVAAELDIPTVPLRREVLAPEIFGDDGFHPGPLGHERTAAAVMERLPARRH